jgi:hexosaminidase
MYRRLGAVSIELEGLGLTHMQSGDAGLRELAGTEDIGALRVFASVLEPVSFGERYRTQKTTQLTALDRLVDAVRPDPPSRYWSERMVDQFLKAPKEYAWDLGGWFQQLTQSVPQVQLMMRSSPRLRDGAVRLTELQMLAKYGSDATKMLAAGSPAPPGWKDAARAKIAEAKKPNALVRFTFLDALSRLVEAVQ